MSANAASGYPELRAVTANSMNGHHSTGEPIDHREPFGHVSELVVMPAQLRASPLLGRERQLGVCAELAADVSNGQSACVALAGEPGIGKTRLARSFLSRLGEAGWRVGMARADEATSTVPFWLARQSMRDLVDVSGRAESAADPVRDDWDEADRARFRRVEDLVAALSPTVTQPGVALLWDDVNWADPSSLDALPRIVSELSARPLLVILGVGSERLEADHPLERALYRLDRERRLLRLPLTRLTADQTVDLASALLGGEVPALLGELLIDQTLGNPFFIEETVKALIEHGCLESSDDGWSYAPPTYPVMAQGVRAAITQRLFRLPFDTQEVLRAASVLGRRISLDGLALMLDSSASDVENRLLPAAASGVVETTATGFEFAHGRIRDVLYESLPLIGRRDLHLAAANALEQIPSGELAMIPLHWRLGGNLEAAIVGELAASDVALNSGGLQEALARRETAGNMAKGRDIDPALRRRALEALGDVQRHLVPVRACTAYQEALSSLGLSDEDRERLWRKLQLSYSIAGNLRAAGDLALPRDSTPAKAAKAYNLAMQGDVARTRALLQATDDANDSNVKCLRHATESIVAFLTGDRDRCLREGRLAYELSTYEPARRREMLRHTTLWQLLRYYMTYHADIGEPMDALAQTELEFTSHRDFDMLELGARSVRGQVCFFRGRWAEAAQDFDWVEAHASPSASMLAPAVLAFFAPAFWIATGDLDRASRILEAALEPLQQSALAPAFGTIPALIDLAHVHRLNRDLVGARRRLEQASALQDDATISVDGPLDVACAELAIEQRDKPTATAFLDQAFDRAQRLGDLLTELECHRLFGVLGTERTKHFTAALELAAKVRSPWLELKVLSRWAAVAELPSEHLHRRRSALERALPGISASNDRRGASLTNREIELLAQIADGLSTREIADVLFISEKTVERHIANIYAKIEVHNRVAASRYYEANVKHHV